MPHSVKGPGSSSSSPSSSYTGVEAGGPKAPRAIHAPHRSPSASYTEGATSHQQHPSTATIIGTALSASLNGNAVSGGGVSGNVAPSRLRRGGHMSPNSLRPPPGFNASTSNFAGPDVTNRHSNAFEVSVGTEWSLRALSECGAT